jgi:hypothetical protein
MESIKQHSTEEILERYLFGSLSDYQVEHIEEHLLVCHSCIDSAEQLLAFVQSLRSTLKEPPRARAAGRETAMEQEF